MSKKEKRKFKKRVILGGLTFLLALALVGPSFVGLFVNNEGEDNLDNSNISYTSAELNKMIEDEPENISLKVDLAKAYWEEGEREKSVEIYEEILKDSPNQSEIRIDLAYEYFLMGKYDLAKEHLEKELEVNPSGSEANYVLGLVFAYGESKYDLAIVQLENYLEMMPEGKNVDKAKELLEKWKSKE